MLDVAQHPDRLDITWEGRPLCTYVICDDDPPQLFRRPYLHPVYTLDGDLVTDAHPADHPWHKGISMTMSVVDDQNFWGGPTYRDGQYVQLDNVGEVRHEGWVRLKNSGQSLTAIEHLSWITASEETWFKEERALIFHVDTRDSLFWSLRWITQLENVSSKSLRVGSPATEGRSGAGYTGLFWRGSPIFRKAKAGIEYEFGKHPPEDFHGDVSSWMSLSIWDEPEHEPITAVMLTNGDGSPPLTRWFVRAQEYPGVAFSFAFDQPVIVEPGAKIHLEHSISVSGRP